MILRAERGRLRIALQTDHARLSGEFAGAWGGGHFRRPDPLAAVRLAADLHDQGWIDFESEPRITAATGRPFDFLGLPTDLHVELYGRGIQYALEQHPYAGLLVSLHGTGLYKQRYGYMPDLVFSEAAPAYRELVDAYLREQEALQQQLIADLRVDPVVLWTHYRWLQAWDLLSLFVCLSDPAERHKLTLGVMPAFPGGPEEKLTVQGAGPGRFCVSPWPFAPESLAVLVPVRYVLDRAYGSDAEFRDAFQAVPTEALPIVLQPCL